MTPPWFQCYLFSIETFQNCSSHSSLSKSLLSWFADSGTSHLEICSNLFSYEVISDFEDRIGYVFFRTLLQCPQLAFSSTFTVQIQFFTWAFYTLVLQSYHVCHWDKTCWIFWFFCLFFWFLKKMHFRHPFKWIFQGDHFDFLQQNCFNLFDQELVFTWL